MSMSKELICFVLLSFAITICSSYFDTKPDDYCFCKLRGRIDDCSCSVDTVDHFNNAKIFPRLQSLLVTDYFRFYKVNLKRDCPFWSDDSRCAIRFCHVEPCDDNDIPIGLKGTFRHGRDHFGEVPSEKYKKGSNTDCNNDHNEELSYLNTTISAASYKEFELWKEHDDAQDNFCVAQEDSGDAEYVDLLLNPERYTGYKGESAHRIWRSIYMENCFRPRHDITSYTQSSHLDGMCLEKRVFYRVVSGLHTSINIHLSSNYLLSEKQKNFNFVSPNGHWGTNLDEFIRRFDPAHTNGEGPQWLRNLYFLYLLELRAIAKASVYLQHVEFYTGNDTNDENVRTAVNDFLNIVRSFPNHFNESVMFNGGYQAKKLKEEFRQHFRNISRIMDCVGCDKCKLWGKLQTQGLGTALKILFSGKFDGINPSSQYLDMSRGKFHLQRGEIVSLINGFGRLSTSIYELEQFRQKFR